MRAPHLLLVALACEHDELHGVGDVLLGLADAWRPRAALLQLALQLQRDGHVQLVHLHGLATALLQSGGGGLESALNTPGTVNFVPRRVHKGAFTGQYKQEGGAG